MYPSLMPENKPNTPNLIWIISDQQRAQALSWMGDPNVNTPNLDRMAQMGLCSTAAVSGYPLCCPYRGALLTGRYPHLIVPGHEYRLPTEQPTLAYVFKENGYHTCYVGKWHLDGFKEKNGRAAFHIIPPERRGGFDTWIGYENNNSPWDCWVHGGEGADAFHYRLPGYETDALTDLFIKQLETLAARQIHGHLQPFFAMLSVQPPHNPYVAPAEWMQRHIPAKIELRNNVPAIPRVLERARRELAGYYSQIENLDWNIGRISAALDRLGLADNTQVLFFSDHGDMHGSHGQFLKTSPWEESVRVPFIIYGRETMYSQHTGNLPLLVNHVDIAPTSLGLCGIQPPEWMQGCDYSAFRLRERIQPSPPDSAFLQVVVPTYHHDSIDRPWRGLVTQDGWKYIALEGQPWLLFDLNEDPYELANLAFNTRYAVERRRLNERLADWIHDTGDKFKLPDL
jgi:arylsulfatase A-like enzyme